MDEETKRLIAAMRKSLDGLGEETLLTRSAGADAHVFTAFSLLAQLEAKAAVAS